MERSYPPVELLTTWTETCSGLGRTPLWETLVFRVSCSYPPSSISHPSTDSVAPTHHLITTFASLPSAKTTSSTATTPSVTLPQNTPLRRTMPPLHRNRLPIPHVFRAIPTPEDAKTHHQICETSHLGRRRQGSLV